MNLFCQSKFKFKIHKYEIILSYEILLKLIFYKNNYFDLSRQIEFTFSKKYI